MINREELFEEREKLIRDIKNWASNEYETHFIESFEKAIVLKHRIHEYQEIVKGYDVELESYNEVINLSINTKKVILKENISFIEKNRYEHENSLHAKAIKRLSKLINH